MSITIMAEVWPLEMSSTDKLVLLALADAANDEEGRTWISVKSKVTHNRAGRLKLSLVIKCSLSDRAVQQSIKRLVDAGHITREEKPGLGVDFWVHPVKPEAAENRGEAASGVPSEGAEPASGSPEGDSGEARTTFAQIQKNPKQPSAGASARESRSDRPPAGPSGGPATADPAKDAVREQAAEGERERALRAAIMERSQGQAAPWLDRSGLKVGDLVQAGGPVGLKIYCPVAFRDRVERITPRLEIDASEVLGVPVRWVSVLQGTRA